MFNFFRKVFRKMKKEKIILYLNDEQLDLITKILGKTRNDYLKKGIWIDEVYYLYNKFFSSNINDDKKIILNEEEFNIVVNVLYKYRLECEENNINTLELDYTLLEIITQKEEKGRQLDYAR